MIVTGGGTTARTWTSTGAARHVLRHDGAVTSLALSSDGSRLVTGSADETARLWVVRTGEELRVLRGHTDSIVSVAFSRDGARVATASTDTTARVWETASGESHVLEGHPEALTSIRFSPDGKRVVTASIDGQVRNWPVAGGQEPVVFRGHVSQVADARFSPDGRWVVTAGPSAAGLFFAESGDRIYFLRGHGMPLTGALFTPRQQAHPHRPGPTAPSARMSATCAARCRSCAGSRSSASPRSHETAASARSSSSLLLFSATNAVWRKSFAAAAANDHVSSLPKRGVTTCAVPRPAATQVPTQRVHSTSSPIARCNPSPAGCSVSSPASPSTNGSRRNVPTRSREIVRETLNVAPASVARSRALRSRGSRPAARASAAARVSPPRKAAAIAA